MNLIIWLVVGGVIIQSFVVNLLRRGAAR